VEGAASPCPTLESGGKDHFGTNVTCWPPTVASDDILPALRKAGVTDDQIDQMLVRNPRAIFEAR
jgi:predicted metal-dependent phosphotriesterase family hydrolase